MKWKKLGKIFDPTDHTLANNCVEFAQSPQTLVFDDFVRIYFSTRERDKNGKYFCLIPNGNYYVKIEKKNSNGDYTHVLTSEPIEIKKGYLDINFEV